MLNNAIKFEKKEYPDQVKLKDGEQLEGIIIKADKLMTSFGECYKFIFEINGKEVALLTKSEFLAGKLNESNPGDVVRVSRTGEGKATRWSVIIVERLNG